jgi:hypothetical protein
VGASGEVDFEYLKEMVYAALCKAIDLIEKAEREVSDAMLRGQADERLRVMSNILAHAEAVLKAETLLYENLVAPEKSEKPCWE